MRFDLFGENLTASLASAQSKGRDKGRLLVLAHQARASDRIRREGGGEFPSAGGFHDPLLTSTQPDAGCRQYG